MLTLEDKTKSSILKVIKSSKAKRFDLLNMSLILESLNADKLFNGLINYTTDYSTSYSAGVDALNKRMILNPGMIDREISFSIKGYKKSKYDINDIYNYFVLFYLLHESVHVLQINGLVDDEMFNKFFELVQLKIGEVPQIKLDYNWEGLFYEHHANCTAVQMLSSVYEGYDLEDVINYELYKQFIKGYVKRFRNYVESPIDLSSRLFKFDDLITCDFIHNIPLEDRLTYGYDISPEEYNQLFKQGRVLKKKIK